MYIKMSELTFEAIKHYIQSFNYTDYDERRVFIDNVVSYHCDLKALQGDFITKMYEITSDDLVCKNPYLVDYFNKLYSIYDEFSKSDLLLSSELRGRDSYSIINYVLYRMKIKNIDTLTLNLFGVRKMKLNEY